MLSGRGTSPDVLSDALSQMSGSHPDIFKQEFNFLVMKTMVILLQMDCTFSAIYRKQDPNTKPRVDSVVESAAV